MSQPASAALSSSSSSRHPIPGSRASLLRRDSRSGSETEREPPSLSDDEEADVLVGTPTAYHPPTLAALSSRSSQPRQRRISAPSPGKAATAARSVAAKRVIQPRDPSPTAGRTSRLRPSTSLSNTGMSDNDDYPPTSTAEYYGADRGSLQRSTTLGRRARPSLPREFIEEPGSEDDVRRCLCKRYAYTDDSAAHPRAPPDSRTCPRERLLREGLARGTARPEHRAPATAG
jgi:hypothetical protein